MPMYLVESYGSGAQALVEAREHGARVAALDSGVRYVRTTFLSTDETLLHVFEAASADELRDAVRLAALAHERIVEAFEGGEELTKEELT
jgi:hypothetical protein